MNMNKNTSTPPEAPADCRLCPRLVEYREDNARKHPEWFNGAVPSFGDAGAALLVIGLAPGVTGANKSGRPFTGDWAGDLLYATLDKFAFSEGTYQARPDDGLRLKQAMITNAVRCVPPANKPGRISGSVIRVNRRKGPEPRFSAASLIAGSRFASAAVALRSPKAAAAASEALPLFLCSEGAEGQEAEPAGLGEGFAPEDNTAGEVVPECLKKQGGVAPYNRRGMSRCIASVRRHYAGAPTG